MPAHPARAILRATLRAARAWEAAASLHGDSVVRAREPVSRTAFASGGAHGWSTPEADNALAAARAAAPPGLAVPPEAGVFRRGDLGRLIMANARASAAAAGAAAADALDAGLAAARALADQAALEACSSRAETRGVVVEVSSAFLGYLPWRQPADTDDDESGGDRAPPPTRRLFTYRVRITNAAPQGGAKVQVLSRGWTIRDAGGRVCATVPPGSPGVVGCTPILNPGGIDCFEYHSSTEIPSDTGVMAGSLGVAVLSGEGAGARFDARVAPFALRAVARREGT
jgi:uncharacterized protein affecting Mg2+/Co2+ transport